MILGEVPSRVLRSAAGKVRRGAAAVPAAASLPVRATWIVAPPQGLMLGTPNNETRSNPRPGGFTGLASPKDLANDVLDRDFLDIDISDRQFIQQRFAGLDNTITFDLQSNGIVIL